MRRLFGFCAVVGLLSYAAAGEAAGPLEPEDWELVWSDEFDGEGLDGEKWNIVVGGGGYGNNESQFYTAEPGNVAVRDGCLVITARKQERDGHAYTSAKITSEGKGEWTYGRFDIRARLPLGQGIWPAVWMMPPDLERYGGWPSCGEIDLMELVGHAPSTVYGTLHYGNPWKNSGAGFSLSDGSTFADRFHDFTLVWAPGRISWYVDGVHSHSETNWYTSGEGARWPAPFDRPFYLQLNVAVGGGWPGYPDETTLFPQQMRVEHVRVYRYLEAYAPLPDRTARPVFLTPRDPLPDGNLVYNGDFADAMAHWEFERYEGGSGSATVVDGELVIAGDEPGAQPWALQVIQRPVAISRDHSYRLSFRARSERPRTLEVNVGKASQPWDSYSGKRTLQLGKEFQTYEVTFPMRRFTDLVARLEFNAGVQEGTVWVDDVSLRATRDTAPVAVVVDGPVRIEAEEFRTATGVDTETCAEGGSNVGWIDPGDVMTYQIDVETPGRYLLSIRHAGETATGRLRIRLGENDVAQLELPPTGGWQTWATATVSVTLLPGENTLALVAEAPGFNLNWLALNPE